MAIAVEIYITHQDLALSHTIRTVDDGTLVDTTDEEIAEEEGIDTEEQTFEPRTIVIGGGHVFASVEADLEGKDVGDTGSVTVEAAEAFGEYDQDQVRTVSADRIPEDDRFPGAHVDIDGQHGHVETVIGGRARVDFNHPLAGEDVEYEYEVLEVVDDPLERAQGLLGMYIDVDLELSIETVEEEQPVYDDEGEEEGTETVELETLYIESVPQLAMNQQWLFSKQQIASQLIEQLDIDQVIVREVFDGSGGGMLGGLGGMGGLEDAIEDADLDEDVDTDELVEELEAETDLDTDEIEE
jgi:FKBP-type peptidyl-prolyl cis-trans isomerase SlyD